MLRRVVIFLALCVWSLPLLAQRSTGIVEPRETDETLVFDVNQFPVSNQAGLQGDFNFAPRVVHSPDSQRAFVSFPGTNKVASFDIRSGELLGIAEVCANPGQLSMTPDGSRLVVPCLFLRENQPTPDDLEGARIGALVAVDTETLATERLDLSETVFSLACNIIFTPDGQSGFVSSIGTDEILRFDVQPLAETGRLALTPGTRPASLTLSPDGTFFGAVLVGSGALPRDQVPDSVQIIDVASFSLGQNLNFQPDMPGQTLVDFRADNRVAFTSDGTLALIADQGNSLASPLPALTPDRAFLFDVATGELEGIFNLSSGGALGADVTPDGRSFVVLTAFHISLVSVEQDSVLSVAPNFANFMPSSRIAYNAEGDLLYVASPISDVILAVRVSTGEIVRGLSIGGVVERPFGDTVVEVPSAPLNVSVSPDGEVITALNFNANNIELLQPTFTIYSPELLSANNNAEGEIEDGDLFTGVAVTNLGQEPAELIFTAFQSAGIIFFDDGTTEDTVEFVNPNTRTLQPNEQFAFTLNDLLDPQLPEGEAPEDLSGWVDVDSDRDSVAGLFLTFNRGLTQLDGGPLPRQGSQFVAFPEPKLELGTSNALVLTNPNVSGSFTATISLVDSEGNLVNQATESIPARARRTFFLRQPAEELTELPEFPILFAEATFDDFEGGYVTVFNQGGLISYLRIIEGDGLAVLPGQAFAGTGFNFAFLRLQAPQVVTFGGNQTLLKMANLTDVDSLVMLTLRDDMGNAIAGPVEVELAPGNSFSSEVAELFQLEDMGQVVSGWVDIESEQPRLVGYVEIRPTSGRSITTVPFQVAAFRELIFPHVAQGLGLSTGVALLNPGEEAAQVQLSLRRSDGTLVESRDFNLAAGQRLVGLLPELFPSLDEELTAGSIRVVSDQVISALELFFSNDLEQLAVVPSSGVGDPEVPPIPVDEEPADPGDGGGN
ncbi:MAG TPA: hypothetical protein VLU25_22260 [Acidobacteriota bacterium]|nr:hypothetical protein [Acidobacteriota bacterium]